MIDQEFASSLSRVRITFEEVVKEIRPDLHRYCARIVGSVIDGEDVVQEALAKAFYSLPTTTVQNMHGWLMRIAHNKAIDFLRREGRNQVEYTEYADEFPDDNEPDEPLAKKEILTLAISLFMKLTPKQRSCVALKDVMDYSLAEISDLLDCGIPEVKAALHRGRTRLRQLSAEAKLTPPDVVNESERRLIQRYVELFNARDFDGVRAMLSHDVRVDLVGRAERRGDEVKEYFSRYAEIHHWRFATGIVENRIAILGYDTRTASDQPAFFILLDWEDGWVSFIRDYVLAPYVLRDLQVRR